MLFRTRSILQLTIAGFLIVATLLLMALLILARQLDELTISSEQTVSQSAEMMRASRQLIEHTSAMERNARQFLVLNDPALLEVYTARRRDFLGALGRLEQVFISDTFSTHISNMVASETATFEAMTAMEPQEASLEYPPLLETAYEMSRLTALWVDEQVVRLREQTRETQQALNLQTLFLVVAALIVAALFVALITQPLRQVDRAINLLGRGKYKDNIRIEGPRDLQMLGQRLDWLRSRMQQLEQQRSAFLRHVSHELKTPLAAMQESAALLGEEVTGPVNAQQKEILGILSNNCQRLLRLIEDLLRHHDNSFAVLETMPEPVRLDQLVREVVNAHQLPIRSAGLTVDTQVQKITVHGDHERIRVVVDNLISNAVKYSPDGSTVSLKLAASGDFADLEVQDQGPGVADEDRERIFTAFYQGAAPDREHYKGTGLGLAIAREYAEAGGGSIVLAECETNPAAAPVKGACFRARFPIRENRTE